MDVKTVNIPDFNKNQTNADIFVFAGFMKPGYHQILIYDPMMHKAYCKDFIINLNLREDLYPEYPIMEGMKIRKGIKNVFDPWKEDTEAMKLRSLDIDKGHTEDFCIASLSKVKEDQEKTLEMIHGKYDQI